MMMLFCLADDLVFTGLTGKRLISSLKIKLLRNYLCHTLEHCHHKVYAKFGWICNDRVEEIKEKLHRGEVWVTGEDREDIIHLHVLDI